MFKKLTKGLLDQEVMPPIKGAEAPSGPLPYSSYSSLLQNQHVNQTIKEEEEREEPETVIGEHVTIKGSISFQRLLRIDGHFEGELLSSGRIIIGPNATVKADIRLQEAFIAGKVEGNITVTERLVLRGRAEIKGDICCPLLSVDEGVCIQGQMKVAKPPVIEDTKDEPALEEGLDASF